ncbi:arginase family protein [Ramlibacter humi]|uniref:arginase family protein n=1 Tax=Ramlibacter humi TaxID=2530451 RepID=UPI00197D8A01|nr:arginase family protein [Ramlibacter humi]
MSGAPVVLDIDGAVGPLPGEHRLPLAAWHEALRFGCGMGTMRRFAAQLDESLPAAHGTVLMGSGDFHHLSWPLVERAVRRRPPRSVRVVVLDNHPDNMRFPFGVHCGSWVLRVARLPQVAQVHVLGITSSDIGAAHAWENHWSPLRSGRLVYWSTGVDVTWARRFGLGAAFRAFAGVDELAAAAAEAFQRDPMPTYFSVDKDVFAPGVVTTNWDQGRFGRAHAQAVLQALRGQVIASDITGEVSSWRYRTWWKRWLSAHDGQDTACADPRLPEWQDGQRRLNLSLLDWIAAAHAEN